MTFLKTIEPHIISNDFLIQQQVLHSIEEYPHVPEEWTTRLLKKAFTNKELLQDILMYAPKHNINEEALLVILQNVNKLEASDVTLVTGFFENLPASLALKYQDQLEHFIDSRYWRVFGLVNEGVKENVLGAYEELVDSLEASKEFDHILYFQAKYLARTIAENEWLTKEEIGDILKKETRKKWYSFSGTLAVYMAGVLRLEEHIPQLAKILGSPDDTVAGEASTALIGFQSDEVVKAVAPYLAKPDAFVYALSVLEYTKTEASVQALMEYYKQTEEISEQDMLFEAICHHFSKDTLFIVKKHLEHEYQSSMVELEPVAYGYFKILGLNHPDLPFWREVALETEMEYRKDMQAPFVNDNKIGRNDPCICGSGKKYKKCCGN